MVHKIRKVKVDFGNLKSIEKAEKMKSMLENKGYNLISEKIIGFDKFALTYEKV
jgi:hypothetical protein